MQQSGISGPQIQQTKEPDNEEIEKEPVNLLEKLLEVFKRPYIFIDGLDKFQSDLDHLLAHPRKAASPYTRCFVTPWHGYYETTANRMAELNAIRMLIKPTSD